MTIRILPEAERDLELGADFYEAPRAGLGKHFSMTAYPQTSNRFKSMRAFTNAHTACIGAYRNDFLLRFFTSSMGTGRMYMLCWTFGKTQLPSTSGYNRDEQICEPAQSLPKLILVVAAASNLLQ